jgi:hypothetical protein
LRIREQRTDSGSIPIEGAYQYVAVRRTSDDSQRVRRALPDHESVAQTT